MSSVLAVPWSLAAAASLVPPIPICFSLKWITQLVMMISMTMVKLMVVMMGMSRFSMDWKSPLFPGF